MSAGAPSQDVSAPESPPTQARASIWREALGIYGLAFIAVLALALVALAVGWVSANLYALVAAVFVLLPRWWMNRRGLDPEAHGLTWRHWRRGVVWGLLATALTVPLFWGGFHLWEHKVQGRTFRLSADHYWRWPADWEGEPARWGQQPGVWLWTVRGTLVIGMRGQPLSSGRVVLEGDRPFLPVPQPGVLARRVEADGKRVRDMRLGTRWELMPTQSHRPVQAYVHAWNASAQAPQRLTITTLAPERSEPNAAPPPLYTGALASAQQGPLASRRDLWWIALWVMTQLLFIALPEEYFYRGYLQTRLRDATRGSRARGHDLGPYPAIVLTSALFALGHVLIPVQGALLATRALVFFPSLVFGWLRVRTDSILAPTLYHACCNLMVIFIAAHYGP